ncbi:MAG: ATP-dependent DNA helicase RecG [Planctomycetota bacterium]
MSPSPQPEPSAARFLPSQPTTRLQGVGPKLAETLAQAGIGNIGDLLRFFPRRLEEVLELEGPEEAGIDRLVRLQARVDSSRLIWLPGRRNMLRVDFFAPSGAPFQAAFFNQPYLRKQLEPGEERILEGQLERRGETWSLKAPRIMPKAYEATGPCRLRYPEVPGISELRLRGLIRQALGACDLAEVLAAALPASLVDEFGPNEAALLAMHEPESVQAHEAARQRFAILEAVDLFRRVEKIVRARAQVLAPELAIDGKASEAQLTRCLPFTLTDQQAAAVRSLRRSLQGPAAMAVLLQGDVGSGKTAVALAAALDVISAGHQVALLAPTELLAEQHFACLQDWLAGEDIKVELLCGSLQPKERARIAENLAAGRIDLVLGTHALISEGTRFQKLGLVIIDEQHRFGVAQRAALIKKGSNPHLLVMTATPIPRTLTLTIFGDMQPLYLEGLPPGRRPVHSIFLERKAWPRILRSIRACLKRGGQVFVVCPKIGEEGEKGGAVRMQQELSQHLDARLVHGRMPASERQEVTAAFRRGEFSVLVGTTVLEVGIDVPNAQLMIIIGADRFGLATLHQLRGRIGRGNLRGLCILSGEETARSRAICASRDGFALAEEDLRIRGAGELLGRAQSGALDFRALDPIEDMALLQRARQAVREE